MTEQRTYSEDEIREIVALATRRESTPAPAAPAGGLTLAEIQDVGREVGLDPADVASAAAALDVRTSTLPVRTTLGAPVEVMRMVPLPRAPTDLEWGQIVAELRTTFAARGRVASQPGLWEWSNGNLHAFVEPSGEGYRLRLGTYKGNARVLNTMGAVGLGAGALAMGSALIAGSALPELLAPVMIVASGAAAFVANRVRLPRWARDRGAQMEQVAARAQAILSRPAPGGEGGEGVS
ncbi:MAG TPA: hypothetical protein VFH27_13860 [Longimicrobiaceae bacterium]|nr:hypothetical protein [Longimicrobiaceae bacterium]